MTGHDRRNQDVHANAAGQNRYLMQGFGMLVPRMEGLLIGRITRWDGMGGYMNGIGYLDIRKGSYTER